jgi:hypothetical protein
MRTTIRESLILRNASYLESCSTFQMKNPESRKPGEKRVIVR